MTRLCVACLTLSLGCLLPIAACTSDGDEDEGGETGNGAGPGDDAAAPEPEGPDAAVEDPHAELTPRERPPLDTFEELMAYDWELEPGQETYYCVYKTITEDTWLTDFEPIQPEGTHHVSIGLVKNGPGEGVVAAEDEDAEFPCSGLSLGDVVLYGAVYNSPGFTLPEGVATKLPKGQQIILSVHVFNASDEPLSGHTGISVVKAKPSEVVHEAEYMLGGTVDITVEPGKGEAHGTCTMAADGTLLSLTHHMHLTGVRAKSTLVRKNGEREVLLDEAFDFYNQGTNILDPGVQVEKGDALEVDCEYDNPTTTTLTFGESTDLSEMCFSFFFRFPAVGESFLCVQ